MTVPTPAEALDQPLRAFPGWFLRVECGRCGAMRMIFERHGALTMREIIAHMRHDSCGGQLGKVELRTGIDGISSRPVRKMSCWAGERAIQKSCYDKSRQHHDNPWEDDMAADLQVGPVQTTSAGPVGPSGPGFTLTVGGRTVATVVYQTSTEAETAHRAIEQALAGAMAHAIAVTTPR